MSAGWLRSSARSSLRSFTQIVRQLFLFVARVASPRPAGRRFLRHQVGNVRGTMLRTLGCIILLGAITPAFADQVLLRDGRILFNVTLADAQTTEARPLQFRTHVGDSYIYDYDTRTLTPIRPHFFRGDTTEVVTTTTVLR